MVLTFEELGSIFMTYLAEITYKTLLYSSSVHIQKIVMYECLKEKDFYFQCKRSDQKAGIFFLLPIDGNML